MSGVDVDVDGKLCLSLSHHPLHPHPIHSSAVHSSDPPVCCPLLLPALLQTHKVVFIRFFLRVFLIPLVFPFDVEVGCFSLFQRCPFSNISLRKIPQSR